MLNNRGSEWNRWDLHVHTASSYDYKYKGADADDVLCQALIENNIKAVAITDHFIIDQTRIKNLRAKAPGVVFFPGVELRTDKGANNLHLILIFSEKTDLDILSGDFDAIMIRQKAKSKESNETIYWEFGDIVDFAKSHDALISIHAGHKKNGIDEQITNAIPVKEAIKEDIAKEIHFFEIGQKRDIEDYRQCVFKDIVPKPLIMCSDNHLPQQYNVKETLWIKADLSFSGLRQCLYQPQERVFIGNIPPILDRVNKNKQSNIASISCSRIDKPVNNESNWFNFNIPLNPGLVAIIGNKGSGKSALSDIIGHSCCCNTMGEASFLNDKRFRKLPKNYANDYLATLTWVDGEVRTDVLSKNLNNSFIEDAQYLPQKYIEDVCNDFDDAFQKEIDKVIFSYVDKSERGETLNLDELVRWKSMPLEIKFKDDYTKLEEINSKIVDLENKKTKAYRKMISDKYNKVKDTLNRHEKSKPVEVAKPKQKDDNNQYQIRLDQLNESIQDLKIKMNKANDRISEYGSYINDVSTVITRISLLETQFNEIKNVVEALVDKYKLDKNECNIKLTTPKEFLKDLIYKVEDEKKIVQNSISAAGNGFSDKLKSIEQEKEKLISSANIEEKTYQKYLADLNEWNEKRSTIIGDRESEDSMEFFKYELDYIDNTLDSEYNKLVIDRDSITKRLYKGIVELSKIYQGIYAPIQGEISQLLGSIEDGIQFQAEVFMREANLAQKILNFINQKYNGKYGRSANSSQEIEECIRNTDFGNENCVMNFVHDMAEVITSDLETAEKRIAKRREFYNYIFGLGYIGVNFKLKMGNRSLDELSPGERGIVLLIFYLALSKESKPIIIDQPEDNLDNQSVYSKLVPCICKAKQKRQVIIVTHNPNIAIACDAEQIIYCEKDKHSNEIRYEFGSIENPKIRNHVVDVLEGTMPAFDLRRLKYN